MGLVAWVSRHNKGSSADLSDLYKLTSPKACFDWKNTHENIFQKFKRILIEPGLGLAHRNSEFPLFVVTDASLDKIGGILYQQNKNNELEPLSYFSRPFTNAEKRQFSRTRELYALCDSIKYLVFFFNLAEIHVYHRP